jgi:hypothetical protein
MTTRNGETGNRTTRTPNYPNFNPTTPNFNPKLPRTLTHEPESLDIAAPRDGVPQDSLDAATKTIPDNEASAIPDSQQDRAYGMQGMCVRKK